MRVILSYETYCGERVKTLEELIRECPELGEIFAEFENRLSCVENSMPNTKREQPGTENTKVPKWTRKQWDSIQQLQAEIIFLKNKLNGHLDKPRTKAKPTRSKGIEL